MSHYTQLIMEFIQEQQMWAGPIMGVAAFAESLFIVGLFVPATVLLTASGALIATGVLDPWSLVICGVIGAILGDAVSYMLGLRYGPRLLKNPYLKKHHNLVLRCRLLFEKYGIWAIFAGRFMGPFRGFMPAIAGIFEFAKFPFMMATIASACLWLPLWLAIGYFGGRITEKITHLSGTELAVAIALIILLIVVILSIALYWRARRKKQQHHRHHHHHHH